MVGVRADVEVAVVVHALGPLRVTRDGAELRLGGPRQRRLLAVLLIHRGAVVSVDRVAEAVFEGEPTDAAATTLRSYVARLRRVLGDDAVLTRAPGYQLALPAGTFDVAVFEAGVEEARGALQRQDPARAAELVRRALDAWQGEAYAEFADEPWAYPESQRLAELRLTAQELLVEAELACGHTPQVLPALETLCREHPLREGFRGQLMTAYYRSGRQADALAAYRAFREELADELGIDPSPALVELERRILAQDPLLEAGGEPLRGYRLGERLGTGRDGTVHAASLAGVARPLVIKTFRPAVADDPAFVRAFEATAHRVGSLRHPAVVPIHDYWREPGAAHVVMPRLPGGTLRDRLARGPLTERELVVLVERIGGALAKAAAADLVHGRVTPENVLYDGSGDPALADFWLGGAVVPSPEEDVRGLVGLVRTARSPASRLHSSRLERVLADPPDGIERLVADLLTSLGRAAAPERAKNPYQGLRAFDEADEEFYFGRAGLVDELVERFSAGDRLVLLVGASGTGKSSAVRAGLLPRLRQGEGSRDWFVATMLPGGAPYAELAEALRRVAIAPVAPVGRGPEGIEAAVRDVVPGELLLVLDQFEELFTLSPDHEQRAFLAALTHSLTMPDSRLRVVATIRADYYDRPLGVQPFGSLVQDATVTIPAMLPGEIEAAVVEPAARVGRTVDRALAAELVGAVASEPAALPALQFVLYELAERGALTHAAYRAIGGLEGAIAARAEELYLALDDEDRQRVRELFERLVVVGEGEPTRRRAERDELATAASIVDAWAAARLLTLDVHPQTRVPTVEVAHEALVREWPRLREWLEADRSELLVLARLRDSARAWQDLDRDRAALLRGTALEAAVDLGCRRTGLPVLEQEFVEQSRLAAEEEQVHQVMLIRRQARTNRRLRWQLGGIGVMLVLALVGGFVALDQRREAVGQRHNAAARELAAAAAANLADDPERSILLALAAIDATRQHGEPVVAEATDALHRAVTTNRVVRTVELTRDFTLSPGGRYLVAEGREDTDLVEIRDVSSGALVRSWEGDGVGLDSIGVGQGAALVATTDEDSILRVWDTATGRLVSERFGRDRMTPPTFSPDGKYVARTSGHVAVYPVRGGPPVLEVVEDHFEVISPATFSPDSRRLVAVSNSDDETGSAHLFDLRTGEQEYAIEFGKIRLIDVAWSPDARWIALSSSTGQVFVVDARTRQVRLESSAGSGAINSVSWSPDSSLLATGGDDGSVRVFRVTPASLEEIHRLAAQDLATGVAKVAFSPDGAEVLAFDFGGGGVKAWALTPSAAGEVLNVRSRRGAFDDPGADFTPDGRSVWVLQGDGRTVRHDLATGAESAVLDTPGLTPVKTDLLLSPDGGLLVTRMLGLLAERNFTVRDTRTGAAVFRVDPPGLTTEGGAWSSDGEHVAVVVEDEGIRVLVFHRSGRLVARLGAVHDDIPRLGFADDDKLLVHTVAAGGLKVWDWRRNRLARDLEADAWRLATSSHERVVTSPGQGRAAEVWNVRTGERLAVLTGHSGTIRALDWAPTADRVATASEDGVVRVFDARSGEQLHALTSPDRVAARGVSFSPDGKRLVANYSDGIARVWTLDLDELIAIARGRVTRELTDPECRQYLHVEKCGG